MPSLLCFGFGYCAEHYVAEFGGRFDRIVGTARSAEKAAAMSQRAFGGRKIEMLVFDGTSAPADVVAALATTDALLISAAPDEHGDPVLTQFADAIAASPVSSIVYLSTIGVYGDHAGAWIDETATLAPISPRSRERLDAERAWQKLGARAGKPVALLRLAGIYGPGQNALTQLANGTARRIVKPGQVFNRIHVADIAQAIDAAFACRADGAFNLADDEPAPTPDVVAYGAQLLGVTPPPEIPYAEAEKRMSEMAKSFYGEVKRARNTKVKTELGVKLRYPTYREALNALHADMKRG